MGAGQPAVPEGAAETIHFHQRIIVSEGDLFRGQALESARDQFHVIRVEGKPPRFPLPVTMQFLQSAQQRRVPLLPRFCSRMQAGLEVSGRQLLAIFRIHQLLDDRPFPERLLELFESQVFTFDQPRLLCIRPQTVDDDGSFAFVFAGANPVREHRQIRFLPAPFGAGRPHVTQRHHPACADFLVHLLAGAKVFDDGRADQPVGIIVEIRSVIILHQAALVKDHEWKAEDADLVGGQIGHPGRIGERLLQFLVRQGPMGEARHGVDHRPDIDGHIQVLQPCDSPPVSFAQILQRNTRVRRGDGAPHQHRNDVFDADVARHRKINAVENIFLPPGLCPAAYLARAGDDAEQVDYFGIDALHLGQPQHPLYILIANSLEVFHDVGIGQVLCGLLQIIEISLIEVMAGLGL